jgi:hypothetical protein
MFNLALNFIQNKNSWLKSLAICNEMYFFTHQIDIEQLKFQKFEYILHDNNSQPSNSSQRRNRWNPYPLNVLTIWES